MATDSGAFGGGNSVDIIVNAIDNASAKLDGINSQLGAMNSTVGATGPAAQASGDSMLIFNQALEAGQMVVGKLGEAYDATIGSTMEYGAEVRNVAAEMGIEVGEASRLIDVTDKFGVSTSALTMAQKTLAKEGLSMSVDTLKSLADQYNALDTQSAKTEFLVKNLGRSGLQMADMFKLA